MKVMICGKGGSGKSTLTTLLAKTLHRMGKTVLVVDADESNLCLHRLLGASLPEVLMDAMGGRQGVKEKLTPALETDPQAAFLKDPLTLAEIPAACLADAGGVKLLVVGKIKQFGEGCACMIGNISKTVLGRLREAADEVVLIDAEAGLEHFGRRVDAGCDLILCIVDPTYEAAAMAERVQQMAASAGIQAFVVLNKVEAAVRDAMMQRLDPAWVVAAIPRRDDLFMQSLEGAPLTAIPVEIEDVGRFVDTFKKPVSFAVI